MGLSSIDPWALVHGIEAASRKSRSRRDLQAPPWSPPENRRSTAGKTTNCCSLRAREHLCPAEFEGVPLTLDDLA